MERRIKSKEELIEEKDEILEAYNSIQPRHRKVGLLSKKERKPLGSAGIWVKQHLGMSGYRHQKSNWL